MSFIRWYYTRGFVGIFTIVRNFLWFAFEFFSIGELSMTLFSPWHRDVSLKYWRGFDLVRFLRLLAENAVSRIVGAIVRTCVIALGLGVFVGIFILGALVACVWIAFPVLVVFSSIEMGYGNWVYGILMGGVGVVILLALVGYRIYRKGENSDNFWKQRWFLRVLERVGIVLSKGEFRAIDSLEAVTQLLRQQNVRESDFQQALTWEQRLERERRERANFWRMENLKRIRPMARQWRFGFTPHIDQYGFDMLRNKELDELRICTHPDELESMKMTLLRPQQNCVLLVAPAGTGKKSLVQFLAKQVQERTSLLFSSGERLINLDFDRVFASVEGMENRRAVVTQIYTEAVMAGNVTLVVEDLDRYMGESAVRSGFPDMGEILVQYLIMENFRLIATVSGQGFHTHVERNEGMLKYMEVIELDPVEDQVAVSVLLDAFDGIERRRVLFTLEALREIVRQSGRFHPTVPLPERALDIAKELTVYWQKHPTPFITKKTVEDFMSMKSGVPIGEIDISEKEKLLRLEEVLADRVIGQSEATRQVAQALKRARLGMTDSKKAIGSFLFLGPTGVGKTELAKVLTKAYFGHMGSLVRLDMSEFHSSNSVDRLMGTRDLNVPGQLASLVRDTPYGVLLLDELEKADSGVLDLFLQILDEGFFTDAFGQRVSFTNMIIIATSNAGAHVVQKRFQEGLSSDLVRKELIEYVTEKNIFRPEFLNRFDGVIFFHPIEEKNRVLVSTILLRELAEEVQKNRGITLVFEEGLAERVVEWGYDPLFGARSLRRFIADTIESQIVEQIIEKNLSVGETMTIHEADIKVDK